ncbi:MAG TPA: DUF4386 family protein [Solirubrobacterales bacterium]|nr:DUF4386 family protein [Solirubrobacterales bacterium]
MGKISNWFPPLTGVIAVALGIAVVILIGEGQDATEKTAEEIVQHYQDNETEEIIGSICIGLVGVFTLYFGGWLRRLLRDAEGPDGILSAVVFGAAVVFSAGAAVGGSIHIALPELADDVDPVALQAINGIDFNMFMFFPVGLGTLALAAGISIVRHGALPKWLGWAGIVAGALFFSPGFFIAFVAVPLWILIVSIIGVSRAGRGGASAATA